MLNSVAKFLLVATSLAPVLGAVAVNQFALDEPWTRWGLWLGAGVLLVALCWLMLRYSVRNSQRELLHVAKFERNDKEVLAFLLAYLLPFVSAENMAFTGDPLTGAYILAVICLVFAHAGALHFNPVLGLLGYHFYEVRDGDDVSHLFISKGELRRSRTEVRTVRLANGIYLGTGDVDA